MHDHQNTFARNLPFQRTVTEQVGSKLFPLSLPLSLLLMY